MGKHIAVEEGQIDRLIDSAFTNGAFAMRKAIVQHFSNRDYQHIARIVMGLPFPPQDELADDRSDP